MSKVFTPHFNLQPTPGADPYILMKMSCTDRRVSYSIGHSIPKKFWDNKKEQAHVKKHPNPSTINNRISEIQDWISEFTEGRGTVIGNELIEFLKLKDGRILGQRTRATNFFDVIEDRIKAVERGEIMNDGKPFSDFTVKNWRSSLAKMKEFNPYLTFDDNSEAVRNSFLAWSTRQGYSLCYADRIIKDWKKFFKLAGRKLEFVRLKNKEIKSGRVDVYLTDEDIDKLLNLELSGSDELIRDRYVFNHQTGFRISDFKHITSENIDLNNGTVDYANTQKTGANASIDLSPLALEILNKYNGQLPRQFHEAVVNRRIKEIAREAGITEMIELKEREVPMRMRKMLQEEKRYNLDPVRRTVKIPKCDLISNHTARRSKITNSCLEDGGVSQIADMLGITYRTADMYNKSKAKDVAMRRAMKRRELQEAV